MFTMEITILHKKEEYYRFHKIAEKKTIKN